MSKMIFCNFFFNCLIYIMPTLILVKHIYKEFNLSYSIKFLFGFRFFNFLLISRVLSLNCNQIYFIYFFYCKRVFL